MDRDPARRPGASIVFGAILPAFAVFSCAAPAPAPEAAISVPEVAPDMGVAPTDHDRALLEWMRMRSLVTHLAAAKERIAVDGDGRDWAPFPFVGTTLQATASSPTTRLRLAIAPGRDEVLFCLSGDAPLQSWLRQWSDVCLDLEVEGRPGEVLRLSFGQDAVRANAWVWDRTVKRAVDPPGGSVDVSFGDCIEGRIDLAKFRKVNGGPFAPGFLGAGGSSWMRLNVNLLQPPPRGELGPGVRSRWRNGPSAASYLLDPERFSPTWAQPVAEKGAAVRCPFFLSGTWFVTQGGKEWPTHEGQYAYDFSITDERGLPTRGEEEDFRNEDSPAWGAEVFAPSDGTVEAVQAEMVDHQPVTIKQLLRPDSQSALPLANFVTAKGPFQWTLAHFRRDTVPFRANDAVRRGELVGRVGDTGLSTGPHLHAEFRECRGNRPGATVPLVLVDVLVGLNGNPDDPWVVHLPAWEVRSGYRVASRR